MNLMNAKHSHIHKDANMDVNKKTTEVESVLWTIHLIVKNVI
jgi:hypothetical protein